MGGEGQGRLGSTTQPHGFTIIPGRLTRLVRAHITAKGASGARNSDHFNSFFPDGGARSPAGCRAVDPDLTTPPWGEIPHIHRAEYERWPGMERGGVCADSG